ncbi:WD40-repeat-containing domain protein [Dipodascopsis tothii]|uniref:WD40-repeat-containing domain protein n=1 Tax=Dipodascopsis tothii TaxID=44089 RepID=UPI0034CEB1C7
MSVHPSRQGLVAAAEDTEMAEAEAGIALEDLQNDNDYDLAGPGVSGVRVQSYLDEVERKRRARQIAVPTDDAKVRARLRELREPVTYFGEEKVDRRDRLRAVLSALAEAGHVLVETGTAEEADADEEFYTPGDSELLAVRQELARYSLARARARTAAQKAEAEIPLTRLTRQSKALAEKFKGYALLGSQLIGERATSIARFSPDSGTIAAGSWTGTLKLVSVPGLEETRVLRGHTDRVGGIGWHPDATVRAPAAAVALATGGGDAAVHLWNLEQDTPVATLAGHTNRVCRVEFHPGGRLLGSASFDYTWRLWDVETTRELLMQEGHAREVYSVAFQDDGALAASAGLDGVGRVWDLRTGRTIMMLDGHVREIYGVAFAPNGYQVATGSGDASIKIWDVRKVRAVASVPAHQSLVSDLRFFNAADRAAPVPGDDDAPAVPAHGTYLASSSYDGTVNVWKTGSWVLLKSLKGHAEKAMSVDISPDSQFLVSSGWDRTVKLWGSELYGL